ncbi:hypothetical protein [Histidinibacterium lentulum]|uniref:DUF2953 domain-containing protein n=1 Tax=Histidinibacterium lentulum TaxID=2480588 RepID=A0A3N2R696_9RHOB|nr:hypothetical protein [Histidinibacterium lentulum]ROU02954.1 hypothetical protein EAT49_06550 [Histidinibacterium lentulum]
MPEALGWLLSALLAAGPALVLLALLLPWHLEIAGGTMPAPFGRLVLRPGSACAPALLRLSWPRPRRAPTPRKKAEVAPGRHARKANRHADRPRRLLPRLLRALPDLIADSLRGVEVISLHLSGRFGLADPAETGMLWGRLCPFLWASPALRGAVDLAPDFDGERFDGEGALTLRLWPLWLIGPALRFATGEAMAGLGSGLRRRTAALRGRRPWSAT